MWMGICSQWLSFQIPKEHEGVSKLNMVVFIYVFVPKSLYNAFPNYKPTFLEYSLDGTRSPNIPTPPA
jgi:hypothetical protein